MYLTKVPKNLFPLTLACLVWVQVTNARPQANFSQTPPAITSSVPEDNACPHNQICTGDIVLISMSDLSAWKDSTLLTIEVRVRVSKEGTTELSNYSIPVMKSDKPPFPGFYYRVKPNKTYYFTAYRTFKIEGDEIVEDEHLFQNTFYYKSRSDSLNPDGAGAEGPISPSEAKAMGLPAIPKCYRKTPGQFCTNEVVHIFWNNDRGKNKTLDEIDLYIDDQNVKHANAFKDKSSFHEFYYTLPRFKYAALPTTFRVTWTVTDTDRAYNIHYENSETLTTKYTPGLANKCKPEESWQKCQDRSFDGS